ncbi:isopentenyl-diphosphate Delta-isomerase [Pedobacter sp. MC2016-05]|uniref:isopentenyl-diphosphate Delta-isomerase n=1 Tax=Pedobacter sp. MC2016-05 TaxID=2994474 RepID=UPI0022457929|nr:isopentenyl-diphosphate Delta-isomerase [Pedobacter sp. MC2016-05]MCX2474537.1 isopentenyl-diphosphate Delta-isomerase [Pedobacter sp. MC2016-05]
MEEHVILVDQNDIPQGKMEKLEAHQKGALHRAFSIFIFNDNNELLLQQRAEGKYHSGGLWTNTCCSHPREGESNLEATQRRLGEEMGMSCDLTFAFNFLYKVKFEDGLTEHELDHVFFGRSNKKPVINLDEVMDFKYMNLDLLKKDIEYNPENYTIWLKICLEKVIQHMEFVENKNGHTA